MTWGRLKLLTKGLLSGDYDLPEDEEIRVTLLQMAMEEVCNVSSPLSLYFKSTNTEVLGNREIIRQFKMETECDSNTGLPITVDGYIVRPFLPSTDNDIINMDEGLVYAVARLMSSYIANMENKSYHMNEATKIMEMYKINIVSLYTDYNEN